METVPTDYGKRIYQGVRVKHTVKDLLAEKRSMQTSSLRRSGSVVNSQPSFVTLPSSPTACSYYGVRRSLTTDMDLHNSKDISSNVYSSSLLPKSLTDESPASQGYSLSLDAHLIDQYVDQQAASIIPSGASAILGSSTSSFPSDSAHYFSLLCAVQPIAMHRLFYTQDLQQKRDSWEQSMPDNLGQLEACPEPLHVAPASSCLSAHEPGTASHCRNPNWNLTLSGIQSYSFHPLEDVQYPAVFSASSNSLFSSFTAAAANDLPELKMLPGSSEESSDTAALQDSSSFWPKEDPNLLWGSYEERRTY